MDLEYKFPGGDSDKSTSMEIILTARDINDLAMQDFCVDRMGLCGSDSKTWIRVEDWLDEPIARIDGDGDLNVSVPRGTVFPIVIMNEKIDPPYPMQECSPERKNWYFGKLGAISVFQA